jgi:hypothetical protein
LICSQILRLEEGNGDVAVMQGNADRKQKERKRLRRGIAIEDMSHSSEWDGRPSEGEKVEEFSVNVCPCTRLNKQPLRHFDDKERENIGSRGMVVATWGGTRPKEASLETDLATIRNLSMLISMQR